MGLTKDTDDDTLIRAMAEVPKLIERPIVFKAGRARLGRPPEAVRLRSSERGGAPARARWSAPRGAAAPGSATRPSPGARAS
ncbi:MAG: ArsC/Spx/MgsR family protein [Paracoccaceae bacterium]